MSIQGKMGREYNFLSLTLFFLLFFFLFLASVMCLLTCDFGVSPIRVGRILFPAPLMLGSATLLALVNELWMEVIMCQFWAEILRSIVCCVFLLTPLKNSLWGDFALGNCGSKKGKKYMEEIWTLPEVQSWYVSAYCWSRPSSEKKIVIFIVSLWDFGTVCYTEGTD